MTSDNSKPAFNVSKSVAKHLAFGVLAALVVGGALVLILVVVAVSAQWIAPYPYDQMHVRDRFLPPCLRYLAGTDEYGRDVFSRTISRSSRSSPTGSP